MKAFIFTLFLALCITAGGQAQNKRLDSLQKALKNTKGNVKVEVDVLNELCWELSNSTPKEALSNGRKALSPGAGQSRHQRRSYLTEKHRRSLPIPGQLSAGSGELPQSSYHIQQTKR